MDGDAIIDVTAADILLIQALQPFGIIILRMPYARNELRANERSD